MALSTVTSACLIPAGPAGAQDFFPPGYDVPLSAPYGEVGIGRPRGPAIRPLVIYFPNSAWRNDAGCEGRETFAALDAAGIAVAELWMSGETLDRDLRSIERGLRTIRQRARAYRLDLSRIVLLGCGAGGHFAALVGTNPELMARAGLHFASIAGVAIVDGAGFDLRSAAAAEAGEGGDSPRERDGYFPRSMDDLDAYSPQSHLAAPNAPSLLLIEAAAADQQPTAAVAFGRRLQAAGSELAIERRPAKIDGVEPATSGGLGGASDSALATFLISRLGLASRGQ